MSNYNFNIKTKGETRNMIYSNNRSFKDFIEKLEPIKINIINSPKISQKFDKTHQGILNPFTRRKIVKKINVKIFFENFFIIFIRII